MEVINISKSSIDKLSHPKQGQLFYRDKKLTGFGLYIGKTAITFYAEKRVNGKCVRAVIGRHGQVTPESARKEAHKLLGEMTAGINPADEKKGKQAKGVSLKVAYEAFKEARKALKPKTLYDYDRIMEVAFQDWQRKRIVDISKDMVTRRHKKLGENNGGAYANLAMRFLRSLYYFSMATFEDSKGRSLILENPVKRLSQARGWYKIERRQRIIKPHEIPNWYKAVNQLYNHVLRDYLLLLLFSGLRRQEAARLKWEDIDFKEKTMTVVQTKNDEPLTLPLSDFLFKLISNRKKQLVNDYLFPGSGKEGFIVEPRAAIKNVIEASEVPFSLHDLRRTFITFAEGLDIPGYAIKRLVNHKMAGDVTAGYIIADVERLRGPMQKITDHLLSLAGMKTKGQVIKFPNVKNK